MVPIWEGNHTKDLLEVFVYQQFSNLMVASLIVQSCLCWLPLQDLGPRWVQCLQTLGLTAWQYFLTVAAYTLALAPFAMILGAQPLLMGPTTTT